MLLLPTRAPHTGAPLPPPLSPLPAAAALPLPPACLPPSQVVFPHAGREYEVHSLRTSEAASTVLLCSSSELGN